MLPFVSKAQLPRVDLSLHSILPESIDIVIIPFGDTVYFYLSIKNNRHDDLDTADFVHYSLIGLPSNIALVAEDTGTNNKVYLVTGDSFITIGAAVINNNDLAMPKYQEYCFYLYYNFCNSTFYTDTVASYDTAYCKKMLLFNETNSVSINNPKIAFQDLNIYLNPAKKCIDRKCSSWTNSTISIDILNVLGQPIHNEYTQLQFDYFDIDIKHLPIGVCQLIISDGSKHSIRTWMKE